MEGRNSVCIFGRKTVEVLWQSPFKIDSYWVSWKHLAEHTEIKYGVWYDNSLQCPSDIKVWHGDWFITLSSLCKLGCIMYCQHVLCWKDLLFLKGLEQKKDKTATVYQRGVYISSQHLMKEKEPWYIVHMVNVDTYKF